MLEQLRISQNGRQQIIEIVSNASGEPAQSLQFLRVPQLFLHAVQRLLCLAEIENQPGELSEFIAPCGQGGDRLAIFGSKIA